MIYTLEERILKIKIDSLFANTIQEFLDSFIPSKKIQHLLIQNKWLTMDGNPVKREDDIAGLELQINIYPENYEYKTYKHPLDIIYEDELFLIVNKPKDVLVHGDGQEEETLSDWVGSYFCDRPYLANQPLHRLDKETSGLVVFSKSIIFQPLLDKLLSEKQIRRNYLAFVKGYFEPGSSLNINKSIGKDRHDSSKRIVHQNGQSALTKVKGLAYSKKHDISILRCTLDTGRTHQIRVHLQSIGHPIINDSLYGVNSKYCIRMGLMADELAFYHPLKEEMQEIEAELPNDLSKLMSEIY